jgi:hypothetical protein
MVTRPLSMGEGNAWVAPSASGVQRLKPGLSTFVLDELAGSMGELRSLLSQRSSTGGYVFGLRKEMRVSPYRPLLCAFPWWRCSSTT